MPKTKADWLKTMHARETTTATVVAAWCAENKHLKKSCSKPRQAVDVACDIFGDRTSLDHLARVCAFLLGKEITTALACAHRLSWRKENNKAGNDCRTNATQYRRSMSADDIEVPLTVSEAERLRKVVKDLRPILEKFHSVAQLTRWLQCLDAKKSAA